MVLGNDGKPLRRLIDTSDAVDNLRKVVIELPAQSADAGQEHVLLYAHGGLTSEAAAIERTMRLGPWFEANGIHPIFIVWRTSLLESLSQIGQDVVGEFLKERDELRVKGIGELFEKTLQKLQEKFDKAFEAAAEQFIGKPVWLQMKQNARAAATGAGGTRQVVKFLEGLRQKQPTISIHMLGHSAGSMLLGHMLDDMNAESGLETLGLYAPACTTDFANKHFGNALKRGILSVSCFRVDNLSETNERDDAVGPYGKSILFLVSRAFEEPRKMPLLGFERCWVSTNDSLPVLREELATDFAEHQVKDIKAWVEIAAEFKVAMNVHSEPQMVARRFSNGELQIKTTHGNLDNGLKIVNDSVRRILGTQNLPREITDLTGF